jgi:hypothetical protein
MSLVQYMDKTKLTRNQAIEKMIGYDQRNDDYYGICRECPCNMAIITPNTNPIIQVITIPTHIIKCENCNPDEITKDIWIEREYQSEKILHTWI